MTSCSGRISQTLYPIIETCQVPPQNISWNVSFVGYPRHRIDPSSLDGDGAMTLLAPLGANCETDLAMSSKRNGPAPQVESKAWVPVTIRDVAKVAGVSTGTVSNVLNRPDILATAPRQTVFDAGYFTGFI